MRKFDQHLRRGLDVFDLFTPEADTVSQSIFDKQKVEREKSYAVAWHGSKYANATKRTVAMIRLFLSLALTITIPHETSSH